LEGEKRRKAAQAHACGRKKKKKRVPDPILTVLYSPLKRVLLGGKKGEGEEVRHALSRAIRGEEREKESSKT